MRKEVACSTHSNKRVGFWSELIQHVLWDLAGRGEHVEVEVTYWNEGRLVEPQPVEKNTSAPEIQLPRAGMKRLQTTEQLDPSLHVKL